MPSRNVQGGPAIPVKLSTNPIIQGGPALPCYAVTPSAIQPLQGGPARPIVLVSDPNYPVMGGPAVPVVPYAAGSDYPATGENPIPVYDVDGSIAAAMGKTVTLPQYLLTNSGTVGEDFETTASWNQDSGTRAANTTAGQFRTGTQSIKLTVTAGDAQMTKTSNIPVSANNAYMRISFYLHDPPEDVAAVTIYASTVNGFGAFFTFGISFLPAYIGQGWNTVEIFPDQWSPVGAADWAAGAVQRLRIVLSPAAGKTPSISWDQIVVGALSTPSIMLTFDDGNKSIYDRAYAYMQNRRSRATVYMITDDIDGGVAWLTTAMLREMDAGGWAIGNHSKDHADLTTLSQAAAQTELSAAKTALDAIGLTKSSMHVAYPGGASNDTVRAAMAAEGMLTGRVSAGPPNGPGGNKADMDYKFSVDDIEATTLAQAKARVDLAVTYHRIIGLLVHQLVDGVPGAYQWNSADFRALIDYINGLNLPMITVKDFYDSRNGPITIPIF